MLNITMVKAITLPELKFPPFLKIMVILSRIMQLQIMK